MDRITHDGGALRWRKSIRSTNQGANCVEVAKLPAGVAVRDSKDPYGGMLSLTPAQWRGFVSAIKEGRLA